MSNQELTIFYDGDCPLCSAEMRKLKSCDSSNRIELVNLHQQGFEKLYPNIDFEQAMQKLHGIYRGEVLLGIDVTHRAWTLVGKGLWVAPLKIPIIRQMCLMGYWLLAKYRHPVSRLFATLFRLESINDCDKESCRKITKY